ncbi:cytochrome c oxidase subunit 2 [Novosphingobium sp. PhB165]|uniref:cytochrome c oxidase subunit II n=1 Tax=Novosphingobium sp. PhB165 TaxID=2485105 RepID=UPI0010EBD765|nr:cytochrome c oxidase subunit II [Novosphingobium sp. PhB165]TCM14377.1 cytochrome c oxidase subunit 2 [Novosphingobium sp. PhB165]
MSAGIELWPPQASHHAEQVDLLIGSFGAMVWLLTLPVFVLMTWFTIRYRRSHQVNRQHAPTHNLWVELGWSVIPFLLTLGFYVWATMLFFDIHRPPPDAMTIHVVAKQWMWKYQHPEGAREINDLHVPAGEPVELVMTSEDVIHSFFVPGLRIKQDLVPGRYTSLWFNASRPGRYALRCAEFCGTDHSVMGGNLIVLQPQDYAAWLSRSADGGLDGTLAETGATLFRQMGCSGCHAAASPVRAPALGGIFGRPVALSDGRTVIADEQYLSDAILLPNKEIAAGYPSIMPTYGNVLTAEQVNALVAYLKSTHAAQDSK